MNLDEEWLALIIEAKSVGLSIEEVKEFIKNHLEFTKDKQAKGDKHNESRQLRQF